MASRTFPSSSSDASFNCSYSWLRSIASVRSCRIVTIAVSSPISDSIFAASASTGTSFPVFGSTSAISPRRVVSQPVDSRPDTNDVKCASLARTMRCASSPEPRHHRKQALGGIVHQRDLALLIGDDDRIGDRIDQQVQAVALGTHLGLGRAQLDVVLVDLPRRHAEVGDVAQNRHDAGAFARIADDAC